MGKPIVTRREVLQLLSATPLLRVVVPDSNVDAQQAELTKGFYVMFVDRDSVNLEDLSKTEIPEGIEMQVIPLKLRSNQTIDDAIKLYRVDPKERL